LLEAFLRHPERFKGKAPEAPRLPEKVWINRPEEKEADSSIIQLIR